MEIIFLKEVDSTHSYLKKYIKDNGYKNPISIVTTNQTNGIGSRDNSWFGEDGNLYFSFVISKNLLPKDLPIQSASIYFSFILKEILSELDSAVWLKWPNDFYISNNKVGGTITNYKNDLLYCGIGLNLSINSAMFNSLDIKINYNDLLNQYFKKLEEQLKWKDVFSKYLIEFKKSRQFKTTINNKKLSLENATLNLDGSILIDNKKVYSLR
ncbi:MAG: biotin--[acetyl-CoA-carboxylase] ligase [Campylobacterota bacterium]|nr:biotin--[acetyl-CoA-carboxylase] ligase [Campylobacterota bacterium]